jgi:hypothetical protein
MGTFQKFKTVILSFGLLFTMLLFQACTDVGLRMISDPIKSPKKILSQDTTEQEDDGSEGEEETEGPIVGGPIVIDEGEEGDGTGSMEFPGGDQGHHDGLLRLGVPEVIKPTTNHFVMTGKCPLESVHAVGQGMNRRLEEMRGDDGIINRGGIWLVNLRGNIIDRRTICFDQWTNVGVSGDQIIPPYEAAEFYSTTATHANSTPAGNEQNVLYIDDQNIFVTSQHSVIKYKIAPNDLLEVVTRFSFITQVTPTYRHFETAEGILHIGSDLWLKKGRKYFKFDLNLRPTGEEISILPGWFATQMGNQFFTQNYIRKGVFSFLLPSSSLDWQTFNLNLVTTNVAGISKGQSRSAVFIENSIRILDNSTFGIIKEFEGVSAPIPGQPGKTALEPFIHSTQAFRDDGLFYNKCRLFDLSGDTAQVLPLNLTSYFPIQSHTCSYYVGALHPSGNSIFVNNTHDSGFGVHHFMITRE